MNIHKKTGFTLVELLVAVLILAGTIGGVLLLYVASMSSSELAWDTTVATFHAEHVLEEAQELNSIDRILSLDWKSWTNSQGLNTLPNEVIDVTFTDPVANPLNIHVTVNWIRKLKKRRVDLETRIAK